MNVEEHSSLSNRAALRALHHNLKDAQGQIRWLAEQGYDFAAMIKLTEFNKQSLDYVKNELWHKYGVVVNNE